MEKPKHAKCKREALGLISRACARVPEEEEGEKEEKRKEEEREEEEGERN